MLNVINFIKENENWESILSEKPYCIKIVKEYPYILLKYNQIDSDLSLPIVQECRGLIIREDNLKICRYAFSKFFNYGEGHAHNINFDNSVIEEKKDGSLISVWFDEDWHVSTNGVIDARNADLVLKCEKYNKFYDLFDDVYDGYNLDKDCTYTFELCSPYNKVVVPYTDIQIFHIATRNNITLQELNVDIGIEKPNTYILKTLDDCITTFNDLDFKFEGYIIKDENFNRIKVKNPSYLAVHNLKGNGTVSLKRVLELIQSNEQEEFLSYFPEYSDVFSNLKIKYDIFLEKINNDVLLLDNEYETRKDLALSIKDSTFPSLLFGVYDKKIIDFKVYIDNMKSDKLLMMIDKQ